MTLLKYIYAAAAGCLLLASCGSKNLLDENVKSGYVDSSQSAFIKVIHNFAGNTPQVPTAPNATTGPQFFLYGNGVKLTGNALSYTNVFPASTVYAAVPSGNNIRFDLVLARINLAVVPNVPAPIAGDTLLTFNQSLDAGKFYTFYIGDTVPTVRVSVKEDLLPVPEYQTYKIRLANFIMNPLDTLTLYSRRQKAEIIQAIPHKEVSDWVQLNLPIISDTLELRKKGTTTTYITVGGTAPAFAPAGLRMYTVVVRGKTGVTAKTNSASIITNR